MIRPPADPAEKLLSWDAAVTRYGRPRNERVVFTNGCFDILHRGHVEYLNASRRLGDRLIVGLNGDDSVRRLKGEGRPVNGFDDRAVVLAGLEAVDAVVRFDDATPLRLIEALLPDVLVKGGDYRPEEIVGAREVMEAGGEVVVAPLVPGRSTSEIIQRAAREHGDG
jgi:D-beta-D-heptose 7-phosphate kinase / D-beta-D-heptose 1-phosphate adenosyltransferase